MSIDSLENKVIQNKKVPALGLGTWKLKGDEGYRAIRHALEVGYRHIDTAFIYENEETVGKAIHDSLVSREDLFVTTKIWVTDYEKNAAEKSIDRSLKALRLDYVDLMLMHWPNPDVPMETTLNVMEKNRNKKLLFMGVSNFNVALLQQAVKVAPIFCNQIEYHMFLRQQKILHFAREHDMLVTAYSPLRNGEWLEEKALQKIADKHNKSIAQVMLRWLVQQDNVVAIAKAKTKQRQRANRKIFDFTLDENDLSIIADFPKNERKINPSHLAPKWDKWDEN